MKCTEGGSLMRYVTLFCKKFKLARRPRCHLTFTYQVSLLKIVNFVLKPTHACVLISHAG